MKPLTYKAILKGSEYQLKTCLKKFKKLEKQENEDEIAMVGRIRSGTESSIEYWIGQIEILTTILGYSQKELDKLIGYKQEKK